jgi:hypothetical protein
MTKEILTQEELQKATLEIAQKSAVDADFREKFIADPKSVVGEILGKKLPDDTVIDVFDSRPEVITTYIVPVFIGADKGITLTPPVLVAGEDWTPQEYADTVHYILNKTAIYADFRKDFLANPRSVIEQQSGKKIPESFLFDVKEVRPEADLTFALPRFVGEEGLTDEELMIAATGIVGAPVWTHRDSARGTSVERINVLLDAPLQSTILYRIMNTGNGIAGFETE